MGLEWNTTHLSCLDIPSSFSKTTKDKMFYFIAAL